MAKNKTQAHKVRKNTYAIIEQDESGRVVMFRIPLGGLFYGSGIVSCVDEMRVDIGKAKLFEAVYKDDDVTEQMIFDDEDRVGLVKWIVKVSKVKAVIIH